MVTYNYLDDVIIMKKKEKRKRSFNTNEYKRRKSKALKRNAKKHNEGRGLGKVDCDFCGKWNAAHRNNMGASYCDDCLESGAAL